ncbi:MFS transporter [Halocatena pleomorpha]|uniref:MFS transporter n=1 Tax=Halocatena pleomorpha TaxID=1785090 RepID=A0A3P3R5E0_9EURY|nr:MFS transporter [Halocatena pleomorpha]RRJ28574.1 MFS transporter [Halocatena pleomorpha]
MGWVRRRFSESGFSGLATNTNFLRLFSGRVITDAGGSLYFIGTMWLVGELTGSAFYTGLATALVRAPDLLSVFIGPLVDRWRLRRLLLSTQLINGIGVLVVPIAAVVDRLSVWLVFALIPMLYFVNGFVYPAQNAALPRIVESDELTRANSLFSMSVRTVDMVANAVAGVLIAVIGAVSLFVINSITFAVAALLFVGVTVPETARNTTADTETEEGENANDDGYISEFRKGIDYVRGSILQAMLVGMMVSNSAATALTALLPIVADSLAGPTAYGLLVAAMGAGSLVGTGGAFLVAGYPIGWVAIASHACSGALLLTAAATPGVWPTGAVLFMAAVPIGTFNVLFFSMVQSALDDAFLGRVTALMRTVLSGIAPVGGVLGGAIAGVVGSTMALYGVGGLTVAIGVYYLLHPQLRSLPAVAATDEGVLGVHTDRKKR